MIQPPGAVNGRSHARNGTCDAGPVVSPRIDIVPEASIPWKFVRQAVYRPAFDAQTSLDLARVLPNRITDLAVMHPQIDNAGTGGGWKLAAGRFEIFGRENGGERWMYSLNPYACHELLFPSEASVPVGAECRWIACNDEEGIALRVGIKRLGDCHWRLSVSGLAGNGLVALPEVSGYWNAPAVLGEEEGRGGGVRRVILQSQGCGMTVYCQAGEALPEVCLSVDFPDAFDFRNVRRCQATQVFVGALAHDSAPVRLASVRQFFSAGAGIADLRPVTTPDGLPLVERNRVFVTASLRGRGLPHPLQGVLSFDPALGDIRLEGVIVFDCGDGLWRNEIASHLIHDPASGEWLGLATGFSGFADTPRTAKQILAFRTRRDPRFGFSVIKATPSGLIGDYEDPALVYDSARARWRLALCMNHGAGYKAALFESTRPDSGFRLVAGPVGPDATGMQIVNIDGTRHVLFGSADRCLYSASYDNLEIAGKLSLDLPPWREETGTRVWPTVIPLPEGSFAPAILVTMDRINYPGMPAPNWTYGAVYFYHAVPA